MRRIFLFVSAGAIAGLLTAAVSIPFYKSKVGLQLAEVVKGGNVDARDLVTYGSTFGIVSDLALGAFVTALMAFLLSRREQIGTRLMRALIGGLLGAGLYTAVDVGLDLLFLNAVHARYGSYQAPYLQVAGLQALWEPAWGLLLPASIALSVLSAHSFRRYYIGLGLWATLFGGIGGLIARSLAAAIMLPFFVGKIATSTDPTSINLDTGGQIEFMAMFIANGAGIGLGFALATIVHKTAWLKSIRGTTEGRTWVLQQPINRVGCIEGNEVFLPPDGTVAPVHAQIQSQDEAHFIVDLVGDATLNGMPMQSAWLKDGDRIGIGASTLVYRTRLDSKQHPAQTPAIELAKAVPQPTFAQSSTMQPMATPGPQLIDSAGHTFALRQGPQVVGRDAMCDIAITWDSSVSRSHAEITVGPQMISITDLGSTNGTFVNGVPVSGPTEIAPGANISFGNCLMRLE